MGVAISVVSGYRLSITSLLLMAILAPSDFSVDFPFECLNIGKVGFLIFQA